MGETVTVHFRAKVGTDAMGEPIYEQTHIQVDNVLVRPVDSLVNTDIADAERPDGIRVSYVLAFPKTYDGPSLAHAKISLTARGMGFEDALSVSGSPDILSPCPTAWNMTVNAGRVDG